MARTPLTPIDVPSAYATDGTTLTWTQADLANGNSVVLTGREMLLARNDDAAEQTVTIDSVADAYGRTGDITTDAIAAAAYHHWQLFPVDGWRQSDGTLHVDVSDADIYFCVLRLPAGTL